ncbi:TetR/AcrR family transcriptional regulator [Nocardia goodfellowii]
MIAAASAEAFSALGYHGVSMEDIATRLDISSTALYRHYPSKYALFREETLRLGAVCVQALELPAEDRSLPADERANRISAAVITAAIANRRSAALVRWQGRYLLAEDRAQLGADLTTVGKAARSLLTELRPELDDDAEAVLAQALFSVASSIGDHHLTLPPKTLARRMRSAFIAITYCELPPEQIQPHAAMTKQPSTFTPELLLRKSIELFHEHGYPNVSMEDIAAAAGLLAPSAVYRYYRSKSDLLAAAFYRAAKLVSDAIGPAIAETETPRQALSKLVDLYVAGSFAERELTFVYYAEIGNIASDQRTQLRNIQRLNVDEWTELLTATRPALSAVEARLLVHSALALVVDLGRRFGSEDPACSQPRVAHLMRCVLFGRHTIDVGAR